VIAKEIKGTRDGCEGDGSDELDFESNGKKTAAKLVGGGLER